MSFLMCPGRVRYQFPADYFKKEEKNGKINEYLTKSADDKDVIGRHLNSSDKH